MRTLRRFVAVMALVVVGSPAAWSQEAPTLPVAVPDEVWSPLYDHVDPDLQARLEAAVRARPGMQTLAQKKKLAVGLVDLTDPAKPKFARVNGNKMMYAASLPKIAILLAAYQAFEDGVLEETPEEHADLGAMIRTSDNAAATRMIDRIGMDRINATLRDPKYKLYDEQRGGGLWVGKRYAKEGRRSPDPINGLSHGATATQVCRLYYLVATGRAINPERSRQILNDLADPGLHHKFVGSLDKRAPRAKLFRKSGTWRDWHSDSVLVWGNEWRRYILVGMVENPNGSAIIKDLVPLAEHVLRAN
jgi:beta-lactamase class A